MKRFLAITLILSTLLLLPACAILGQPTDDDGPKYDEVWADLMDGYQEPNLTRHFYGTFEGWKVMLTTISGTGTTHITGSIGSASYECPAGSVLQAYKDGTMLTLEEAYNAGHLSDESIATILALHEAHVAERLDEKQIREQILNTLAPIPGIDLLSIRIYGEDNGFQIVFAEYHAESTATTIEIAGCSFRHDQNFALFAHKNGEIKALEDAYQAGLISAEAIENAAKLHKDY